MDKKVIAVFTSARSEYGPLKPLISQLYKEHDFDIKLLVGGGHFLKSQGFTYTEILEDGFRIDHRFPFLEEADFSRESIVKANGVLQIQFCDYLQTHQIHLLIVMGDRSELIPMVSSAMLLGIPVAHISGGEITEGSTDNQVRHAVTKMAHLHFPATEEYKSNIIKMGEEEWRICVSGEPSLDSVLSLHYPEKQTLFTSLNLETERPTILSTFHSETIRNKINGQFIIELTEAIINHTNYQLLFTAANTDMGGEEINSAIRHLSGKHQRRVHFKSSLGKLGYYSVMKYADLMLGNSSSGIIEAQSFNLPVINVGDRQKGRLRNKNVVDVSPDVSGIIQAIDTIRSDSFITQFQDKVNIYGDGDASQRIIDFLKKTDFSRLLQKASCF